MEHYYYLNDWQMNYGYSDLGMWQDSPPKWMKQACYFKAQVWKY